jgi:hypothetical protein
MLKLNLLNISISLTLCLMLAACSNTPKQPDKPVGFKAGTATFNLLPTKLQLNHGNNSPDNITLFASQDEMQNTLHGFIEAKMKEVHALDAKSNYAVEILVSYDRIYNIGGKALNKPRISYTAKIYKDKTLVRTHESGIFTTRYAGLKDTAVNFEIAAFKWDKEDEPKDLDVLASVITTELKKIGD